MSNKGQRRLVEEQNCQQGRQYLLELPLYFFVGRCSDQKHEKHEKKQSEKQDLEESKYIQIILMTQVTYFDVSESITLKLSYFCSILNNYASFEIQALILENSQLKVIVGVHTIRASNLFHLSSKQMVLKSIPIL